MQEDGPFFRFTGSLAYADSLTATQYPPLPFIRERMEGWMRFPLSGQMDWSQLWMVVLQRTSSSSSPLLPNGHSSSSHYRDPDPERAPYPPNPANTAANTIAHTKATNTNVPPKLSRLSWIVFDTDDREMDRACAGAND